MSISEKLLRQKQDFDAVYSAGKKAGNDAFWDAIQNNGDRTDYASAFKNWGIMEYIRPKYKVVPKDANGAPSVFENNKVIKKVEKEYFDFSEKPQGTNNNAGYYYTFTRCIALEEIEDIGFIPQHNYYSTFSNCTRLHTIAKIGMDESTLFNGNTFNNCNALKNITIDGTIGQNGFDIHWSTKLSAESIDSIVRALSSTTTGLTVTLPADAWNTHATVYGAPNTDALWESKSNWTINELAV